MPKLSWISDDRLKSAVAYLLAKAKEAKTKASGEVNKNVTDPFSALFEIAGFELDYNTWIVSERNRQAQKTLQNHIGDFHQVILGSVEDWENKRVGNVIDLVSESNKIVAEVKNKHNTVSGGSLVNIYKSLEDLVMRNSSIYKGYVAYYVAIIPKTGQRYDKAFTPPDREKSEKSSANEKIRQIDGASFYHLVTGDEHALENLFIVLPEVINECSEGRILIKDQAQLMRFFELAYLRPTKP